MNFDELTSEAEKAAAQGRVRTARSFYEEALSRFPEHTLFVGYNLGALLQMQIGEGVGARSAYDRALAGREQSAGIIRGVGLDELEANVCENLMLLALSFEEYEQWASRLEKLQADNPILIHQRPRMRDLRERGHAWWAAMLTIAKSGYDADPAKDPGRYAAAASVLQLLLLNRRQLRVPRDEYRFAVVSYAALAVQAWAKCGMDMVEAGLAEDPNEFAMLLEQALPLVEESATANPNDADMQDAANRIREALSAAAQYERKQRSERPQLQRAGVAHSREEAVAISWGQVIFVAVVLATASYLLRNNLGPAWPWGALGGALFIGVLLERGLSRLRVQAKGPPPEWQVSPALIAACRTVGVQGFRFELEYALIAPDQSLAIRFKALDSIPDQKRNDAYLALRCVVALSLPAIASSTPAVELINQGAEYSIDVGPGVHVPAPALRRREAMIGPLKAVGEIEGDAWWVGLEPVRPDPSQFFTGTQGKVLKPLVKTFDRLSGQIVVLPG